MRGNWIKLKINETHLWLGYVEFVSDQHTRYLTHLTDQHQRGLTHHTDQQQEAPNTPYRPTQEGPNTPYRPTQEGPNTPDRLIQEGPNTPYRPTHEGPNTSYQRHSHTLQTAVFIQKNETHAAPIVKTKVCVTSLIKVTRKLVRKVPKSWDIRIKIHTGSSSIW